MGYFIKKALEKVQRPFREWNWYKMFYRQKSLYKLLDDRTIKNWPNERLAKEKMKAQYRIKKVERFERLRRRIMMLIIMIFGAIAIIQPKLYWAVKLVIVVATLVYAFEYIILLILDLKARDVLLKNEENIMIEINRRAIADANYTKVESIDSPELCAILVKRCKPIIMKVDEDNGRIVYNVLLYGQIYRLEQEEEIERKIKITD